MKYSRRITYQRNGKTISYTREYTSKHGKDIKIVRKGKKSYAYREYKVNGKIVRRRIKNIMKNGKLTKYGEEYIREYKRGLSIDDQNDLQDWINQERRDKKNITVEKLTSHLSSNKIERFIYNMGGEPDDLANDLGVDYDDLFDEDRWNFKENTFKFEGETYEFTFDYDTHNIKWRKR